MAVSQLVPAVAKIPWSRMTVGAPGGPESSRMNVVPRLGSSRKRPGGTAAGSSKLREALFVEASLGFLIAVLDDPVELVVIGDAETVYRRLDVQVGNRAVLFAPRLLRYREGAIDQGEDARESTTDDGYAMEQEIKARGSLRDPLIDGLSAKR